MPYFKLDDLDNTEVYKKTRGASLSRISNKPHSFVFSKKHTFKLPQKKVQPLFIFESGKIDAGILKAMKSCAGGALAEGSCWKNKEGVLVFELTKGDLDGFDMVPKFEIGGQKPPEAPPEPEAAKSDAAKPATAADEAPPKAPTPPPPDDEENQQFKARLANGLKRVKSAGGKESFGFVASVAKPCYGLLFAKNSAEDISAPHKKVLTDLTQSTKFIVGKCLFEENAYTFVLDSVPGGLAKHLKNALKEFTGLDLKVRVRDTESKLVADGDTDVYPEEAQATAPKPATPAPPPAPPPTSAKPKVAPAQAAPAQPEETGTREIKLSTYLTGRANLRSARERAEAGIKQLQEAILARCKDESFYSEVETKSQKLFELLKPIDDSVADKLDEAGRCADRELQAELNKQVRALIQKQLAALRGHPLSSFVEKNPFGKFIIKQPVEVTLAALDKQLA